MGIPEKRHAGEPGDDFSQQRKLRKSFGSGLAVANLQDDSFPLDVAKLPQPLAERLEITRCSRWSARSKVPDLRDLERLRQAGAGAGCTSADSAGGRSRRRHLKPVPAGYDRSNFVSVFENGYLCR
jgi:hypothetical protein